MNQVIESGATFGQEPAARLGSLDARSTDANPTRDSSPDPLSAISNAAHLQTPVVDGEFRFTGAGVRGISFERRWTTPGVHPYDEVDWERRTANISNESGKTVFEQTDVEVPRSWSQLATNVVVSKYFRGHVGTPQRETSVRQLIDRVVTTITAWAATQHYFATDADLEAFKAELTHLLLHQKMAFNSPVWFNVGVEEPPQCSACQPYRAMVSTPDGMIPIGQLVHEVAIGRHVYDASGTTRIVAVKSNGSKPVQRVRLRNGNYIEATPDHVVRAVRERRTTPEWLRVDELTPGMRLHLHPHRAKTNKVARIAVGSPAGGSSIDDAGAAEVLDLIPESPPVAIAEAALAGWLQADGFVGRYDHGTNRSLTIEFQVADDDEYDWVIENLDIALPGVHRHIRDADTKQVHVRRIRLYGEVLRDFVDRWQLLQRRLDIRVPSQLWTASYDEICAYLKSVFQTDGYVTLRHGAYDEAGRIGFAVISERWTEDIQLLLNAIGIYSRRTHKREARDDRQDLHEVAIAIGSERARFAELVGFVSRNKQARLLESLNLRGLKTCPSLREEEIVAIDELGMEEVYDIQTESGEYLSNNVAVHNCFINSVEDSMSSIMDLAKTEAMLFKYGSGAGVNLSTIRGSKEKMSGGGIASGPVSFMKGFDAFAGVVKSGGKTRRAAKMVILDADHPDVIDFIDSKANEEKKAWALIEAGYDPSFTGEAYGSVFFQNANHSVRMTDEFMHAVESDGDWTTHEVTTGDPVATLPAATIFRRMAEAAWICGDPGIQYDTTINDWNPVSNSARQYATNPCSEFSFINDTSCNLASLNLMKFVDAGGEFDIDAYRFACRVTITAQEIIVDNAGYPTPRIEENSHRFRPLGIGYANLGALLMSRGLAYDSDEGRTYAAAMTAIMTGETYRQSAVIARDHGGPFNEYLINEEPFLGVIQRHRDAAYAIPTDRGTPAPLIDAARLTWDQALELGRQHGFRNAQVSLLAPTGTIAFMMDCDTTGIEPDIALIKYKKLVGEGFLKIVNNTVPAALRKLGYDAKEAEAIVQYIDEHETIEGAPRLKAEHLPVFDCAFKPVNGERSIHYMGHVRMMGATQPFLSGAISKTVNMPEAATAEDIEDVYLQGWKLGLKAIAIYRDGSKRSQPLSTGKKKTNDSDALKAVAAAPAALQLTGEPKPYRRRLPAERAAVTHKFQIAGHEGYITVGLYEDGQPGELFLKMAKEGSTISGLMDTIATMTSVSLQYGVPLRDLVNKFAHVRFEPAGFTGNSEIPIAKSIVDYVFRWMGSRFLPPEDREALGLIGSAPARAIGFGGPATAADAPSLSPSERPTSATSEAAVAAGLPEAARGAGQPTASDTAATRHVGDPSSTDVAERDEPGADSIESAAAGASSPAAAAFTLPVLSNGNRYANGAAGTDGTGPFTASLGAATKVAFSVSADSPSCADCGSIMVRNGSCYKCLNCGSTSGCS